VSCPSAGNCAAAGYYASSNLGQGLLLTESSGTWGQGVEAQLPANSNPSVQSVTIDSLSCSSVGNCGAGGSYIDSSGNQQGLLFTASALRSTSTSVSCANLKPTLRQCTATVSDTSPGTEITPTGTVGFSANGSGVFSSTTCTLSATATVGQSSCSVYYATSAGAASGQTITATYGGDSTHTGSSGTTTLS
jgi:hypothetical protein